MAIDFTKPATTDNYLTQFVPNLQANQTALSQWLDSTAVTITGTPPTEAKRFNTTTKRFERYTGSAWAELAVDYLKKTGGDTATRGNATALDIFSGNAAQWTAVGFGRTAIEGYVGVSGGASSLTTGDAAGDMTIRATQRLWLSIGASGQARFDSAGGAVFLASLSAAGAVVPYTAGSSSSAGTLGGFPANVWYNAGAATDSKRWDLYANATTLIGRIVNDANNSAVDWLQVVRVGMAVGSVTFPVGNVGIGAVSSGVLKLEVTGAAPNGGTQGIRVLETGANAAIQMLRTSSTYSYAGVGGNEGWIYNQGASNLCLGPDGAGAVKLVTNGAVRMTVAATGSVGIGRAPGSGALEVNGTTLGFSSEAFRVINNGGYVSFYDTAQSIRLGYIQNNFGGDFILAKEDTGNFAINGGGATRLSIISATGVVNVVAGTGKLQVGGIPTVTTGSFVWALNGSYSAGHAVTGRTPDMFNVYLECLTAEAGYAVGERVMWAPNRTGFTGGYTLSATAAFTTVYVFNTTVQLPNKASGTATSITPANWSLRIVSIWQ